MKTMAAENTLNAFAREFQKNAIDNHLRSVPGLGPGGIRRVNDHNINTTEELVGKFFMLGRDEVKFIEVTK
jgi:hypothetical protein